MWNVRPVDSPSAPSACFTVSIGDIVVLGEVGKMGQWENGRMGGRICCPADSASVAGRGGMCTTSWQVYVHQRCSEAPDMVKVDVPAGGGS